MSRLCRGNAPHFCANCGSTFEAKTDEDLLQNAVSPPPASGDVERLKDMFMRGWNLGFTAIAREPEEIERERRCDWEYVLSTLTHPTPGEQA